MIKKNTVEIWLAHLGENCSSTLNFRGFLSKDELIRLENYRIPVLAERFLFFRGLLRVILSDYLSVAPQEIVFMNDSNGKPRIQEPLKFNVSHTENFFCAAVSTDFELGIDIENIDRKIELAPLVKRFFSEKEFRSWDSFPEKEKATAFFRCWTRKEAYLKTSGVGIAGLGDIEGSFEILDSKPIVDIKHPMNTEEFIFHEFGIFPKILGTCSINLKNSIKAPKVKIREWRFR
ncbi:MAG: 4'-phosphopantetheinyl transferase superfamily protein [Candidatus Riflebacteria bacterium]|nr:4'-phosphopantetheinyl transferase superfamily protein [Candidatus Riflebacteria bacterium]